MEQIPQGYQSVLGVKDTLKAIEKLRKYFQEKLSEELNLTRASAPLFVIKSTGLNDNLSGRERAVSFSAAAAGGDRCEIVHSLAKWKRMALKKYGFKKGEGLYADMNAIRSDEEFIDNLHSIYVDQWDWERIIGADERTATILRKTVEKVYSAVYQSAAFIEKEYNALNNFLPEHITFVQSAELVDRYPDLSPRERENAAAKEYGAVFVIGIGGNLQDGKPHDLRAPDYDDWNLNGDILVWYPVLQRAVELSSMGIRVDETALSGQLKLAGICDYTDYHKSILSGEYPYTVGGGIGQSRLCLVLLHKAHIAEVQSSIWQKELISECAEKSIAIL